MKITLMLSGLLLCLSLNVRAQEVTLCDGVLRIGKQLADPAASPGLQHFGKEKLGFNESFLNYVFIDANVPDQDRQRWEYVMADVKKAGEAVRHFMQLYTKLEKCFRLTEKIHATETRQTASFTAEGINILLIVYEFSKIDPERTDRVEIRFYDAT